MLRTVVIVSLVALVGVGALHQLFRNREAGPRVPQLVQPSYAPVPQRPTAQSSVSLTTVIRMWTDPGIGNTGRTIGGVPLWTTPAAIPLDRAGLAVVRCSAIRTNAPGPWSRMDPGGGLHLPSRFRA